MRKLAVFAFSFSAAVFAAVWLEPGWLLFLGAAVLALLACAAVFLLRPWPRLRRRAVLALYGLAVGALWTAGYSQVFFQPAVRLDNQTAWMTGDVAGWPQEGEYGGYSVLVRIEAGGLRLPAILYTDGQGADLRPGDRVSSIVHYTLGDRTFAGEEITYYTAKGIFLRGEAYGQLRVERPERVAPGYWPAFLSKGLREGIEASFPPEEAGLVGALVTGNREGLTDRFTTSLQRTGLSHTVAVSGMHLAFLSDLLTRLLGRGRRSTAVLTILWSVLFCGVAGNTPSVLRAAVMIILLQLAPLLGRERDSATSLGFALMVLLAANPFSAAHVGLQLSFASVAGILLRSRLGRKLRVLPYFSPPISRPLWEPRCSPPRWWPSTSGCSPWCRPWPTY